jgi:hypothetical protein
MVRAAGGGDGGCQPLRVGALDADDALAAEAVRRLDVDLRPRLRLETTPLPPKPFAGLT